MLNALFQQACNATPELRTPSAALAEPASSAPTPTFEALFATYEAPIYAHVLRMVGDAEEARELTQDTFLKVYRALPTFTPRHARAWVHRIATNVCLDTLRRRRLVRWQRLDSLPGYCADRWVVDAHYASASSTHPAGHDPVSYALGAERREQVRASLRELAPPYQAALVLREYRGLSYDEIGQKLHRTRPAVKSLLYRARKEFRRVWQERQQDLEPDVVTRYGPPASGAAA
jgi:RNA polymerase sigma-70 factor (ECF subfamily)